MGASRTGGRVPNMMQGRRCQGCCRQTPRHSREKAARSGSGNARGRSYVDPGKSSRDGRHKGGGKTADIKKGIALSQCGQERKRRGTFFSSSSKWWLTAHIQSRHLKRVVSELPR